MTRRSRRDATRQPEPAPDHAPRHERGWVAVILAVHLALVVWGSARNSVSFDENFHLPSGYLEITRGDFTVSTVNPPLIKELCAVPARLAGARPPDSAAVATHVQQAVGISFMRANRDQYHHVFFAARLVTALFSLLLGLFIWRFSRHLHGPWGGLLSLGFYAFTPDVLAHAGVVGMDLPTGLALLACIVTWWGFTRTGEWKWLGWACLAVGFAALVRFTILLFVVILAVLTAIAIWRGWAARPRRLWLGLALLVPAILIALQIGYLGHTSFQPLEKLTPTSPMFQALRAAAPWLRLPLPDSYLQGLDHQALEGSHNLSDTFVFGQLTSDPVYFYFPLAMLLKWPLGLLLALAVRAILALVRRGHDVPALERTYLLLPALLFLFSCMFLVQLNAGVRYLLPILPLLCVWLGGLGMPAPDRRHVAGALRARRLALALAGVVVIEALTCAPYFLSFFNLLGGGPGNGDAIVNDSNVDWGQGLIALRDEMQRRGIQHVYLTYHGTVDPRVYGIQATAYLGGPIGNQSDWLAVSSFFFRGLGQRMTTLDGITRQLWFDFSPLWAIRPEARPARCMYLFHIDRSDPRMAFPGRLSNVGEQ